MDRKVLALLGRMDPRDLERALARMHQRTAKKRARLEARRKALVRRLEAIDREMAALPGAGPKATRAGVRGRKRAGGRPKGGVTSRDVAFGILSRKGGSMELKDLARAVLGSGQFHSSSPVFAQNLGMALRKDSRFRKVGRGLYTATGAARAAGTGATSKGKKTSRKAPGRKTRRGKRRARKA